LTYTSYNPGSLPVEFDFSPVDLLVRSLPVVCIVLYSHLVELEIYGIKRKSHWAGLYLQLCH